MAASNRRTGTVGYPAGAAPLDDWNYVKWLQSQLEHPDEKELMWLMEKLHQAAFSEDMLTKEEYEQCTGICREIKYHLEKKK